MTKRIAIVFIMICATLCAVKAQSAGDSLYLSPADLPNAEEFLPAPPDWTSKAFTDDFYQWQWGNSMRNSNRGQQASDDSRYGTEQMAHLFGNILGITISEENSPAIYRLISKGGDTGALSTDSVKAFYSRQRPFVMMKGHTWGQYDNEAQLSNSGSFPSKHAALSWSTALILAEMTPNLQNNILKGGYDYGDSRIITGANWQSDVDAARLTAAAAVARIHCDPDFTADLLAAQAEYRQLIDDNDSIVVQMPQGQTFLPVAVDTVSNRYYGDVIRLWLMKPERNTERGIQAVADADYSDSALLATFAPALGIDLATDTVPALSQLLGAAKSILVTSANELKSTKFRKRPFVQLADPTLIPTDEEAKALLSSYPSVGAQIGWGLALLLTEVAPQQQNDILARGYEFGRSRIIAGFNFPSDVQAGRILASAVVARLHTNPIFKVLLQAAIDEYANLSQLP